VSDYYTALKAWQNGRNEAGDTGTMPEGFRIRPALKRSPEHVAALEQVRNWTRARFKLPAGTNTTHLTFPLGSRAKLLGMMDSGRLVSFEVTIE